MQPKPLGAASSEGPSGEKQAAARSQAADTIIFVVLPTYASPPPRCPVGRSVLLVLTVLLQPAAETLDKICMRARKRGLGLPVPGARQAKQAPRARAALACCGGGPKASAHTGAGWRERNGRHATNSGNAAAVCVGSHAAQKAVQTRPPPQQQCTSTTQPRAHANIHTRAARGAQQQQRGARLRHNTAKQAGAAPSCAATKCACCRPQRNASSSSPPEGGVHAAVVQVVYEQRHSAQLQGAQRDGQHELEAMPGRHGRRGAGNERRGAARRVSRAWWRRGDTHA